MAAALRIELIERDKLRPKSIYWAYRESECELNWIHNNTVNVNGIVLDLRKDQYDFIKGISPKN